MSETPKARILSDLFAGAGMGLLLGTVMGLTTTPVVSVVVGALAALLGVFMGLDGSGDDSGRTPRVNGVRIGALGAAAVIGFGLGLYVRINNPLAESPVDQMARWAEALPEDPTLAKQMMLYERTGISPEAFTYGDTTSAGPVVAVMNEEAVKAKSAILFSSLSKYDACSKLDPEEYGTPADVLALYARSTAPAMLKRIKAEIEALDPEMQPAAVITAHLVLCAVQDAEDEEEDGP
ncbi:hypothetical protein [Fluviibacterium sp. S390]|uniref:hypothetical protein n=1 Tax=Fluviibacterium sp. S390 TaxID=3415139 RepID=UPI003C7E9C13